MEDKILDGMRSVVFFEDRIIVYSPIKSIDNISRTFISSFSLFIFYILAS